VEKQHILGSTRVLGLNVGTGLLPRWQAHLLPHERVRAQGQLEGLLGGGRQGTNASTGAAASTSNASTATASASRTTTTSATTTTTTTTTTASTTTAATTAAATTATMPAAATTAATATATTPTAATALSTAFGVTSTTTTTTTTSSRQPCKRLRCQEHLLLEALKGADDHRRNRVGSTSRC
jgi:cell division septation protein DedD